MQTFQFALLWVLAGNLTLAGNEPPDSMASTRASSETATVRTSRSGTVRLAGLSFGVGYSQFSRFHAYPFYPRYPFYSWLYGCDPISCPPFANQLLHHTAGKGRIELRVDQPDADVYLNGALAGKLADLRKFWLEPGAYDLRIQDENGKSLEIRVYVLSGKRLAIDGSLAKPSTQAEDEP